MFRPPLASGGKTATKGEELGTRSALPTVALRHRGLIQFLSASSNFDQGAPKILIFNSELFYKRKKVKNTGCIKKMVLSNFSLKSIPVVGFYLFRGVLEPEFRA